MANIFVIVELLGICIIFAAMALLIVDDDGAREQKLMGYFLCGALIQNAGYLQELTASTIEAAFVAVKVQYLGSTFVPLCYCCFIYSYCYQKAPQKLLNVLGVIDFSLLGLIMFFDHHSLYYHKIDWLQTAGGHPYLSIEYGPAYPVFLVCACIVPYFLSAFALVRAIFNNSRHADGRRYKTVMFLSVLPLLALVLYAGKVVEVFDLTPVVLGLVLSLVVILLWRGKTHDFRRLASDVVLESMGDGIIALDTQNRLLFANKAAVHVFPELFSRKTGDSIGDIPNFHGDMLQADAISEFGFHDRFYESHTKSILDRNKRLQGYVILILDVTDNRNYINEIKRIREEAERANMAKSEFLANMSHEIRTPMNAIIGLSDIILEESAGRKVSSYACDIKSASQNLLNIINGILDLSKVEAGKMELVLSEYYVKAMVGEIVNMMDIAASQHGLLMKYEYDTKIPCRYYGDEGRIKQILINLLNNAIKFTKEGYVKIKVGGRQGETDDVELLVFQVEDSGCGIRKEDQEKVFENFKQVDSKKNRTAEGTGLGLSITKHLVELMGGQIVLESTYGLGTTFTVTVPQKIVDKRSLLEMPDVPELKEDKVEHFVASEYKVLVVDDNLINRKVARGFLKAYKFKMDEAQSGREAIELVKKTKYDMIFMDHMMPEMDGIEAVEKIRNECGENGKTPVIIALTANAMEGVREMFLQNGFQDFLAKPLDKQQLLETLIKWVPNEFREEFPSDREESGRQTGRNRLLDIHIPGIDMAAVQRYQSGSLEDFMGLLELYHMDGERKAFLLKELYDKGDFKDYEIEVHGLKSASANVGAMEVSSLAKEHERAANKKDKEFIAAHFDALMDAYKKQLEYIGEFLGKSRKMDFPPKEEFPKIEKELMIGEVKEALTQLEHFHSKECAGRVEKLLTYQLDKDTREKLKEIQRQLKLYEDSLAEDLLRQLLEWIGKEELANE